MQIKFIQAIIAIFLVVILVGCSENQINDNHVTITFDTQVEGITIDSISGDPGKNITVPDDPTREGYVFDGWVDSEGNAYRLTRFPSESITLYANWVLLQGEFKIEFLTMSSEYIEPIYVMSGENIPTLPIPEYTESNGEYSSFSHWALNDLEFDDEVMPTRDLVLTAVWDKGSVAIFFNTGTDLVIQPVVGEFGDEIESPNISPKLSGKFFEGWQLDNRPYIFETMPDNTITLEASWLNSEDHMNNESSSLPKLFINLENNKTLTSVNRDDYTNSQITIYDDDLDNEISSLSAEFKGRGNGSWDNSGPKRGYRIKFFEKQSLFGEAKSKHWVLLAGANFYDPTLLKTILAFDMTKEVFSNIEYASSTNWVELYVNGEYRGVYILAEHIRDANNRVDVDSEYGVNDTGYLIEYDAYASNEGILGIDYFMVNGYRYGFSVKSPDSDDYLDENISESQFRQQIQFIKDYTSNALTAALNAPHDSAAYQTFESLVDIPSFVDMYILHELFKNADTGWSSFYMYKKAGGKLYAGPPWDFDSSAGKNRGNQSYSGIYVAGSVETESSHTASELYLALLQVPAFKNEVRNRWQEISNDLTQFINQTITDDFIIEHKETLAKNYYFWSMNATIEGLVAETDSTYIHYASLSAAESGWETSVNELKSWLLSRILWLDDEWS